MTEHTKIYRGISRAAWGYLLVYFDISFNGFNILPDFIGWLFFLSAIGLLQAEQPELRLLRPFSWLWVIWSGVQWIWPALSLPTVYFSRILLLPLSLAELYFHFQFLTNLSFIAAMRQPEGFRYDKRLLVCRTVQTLTLTAAALIIRCFPKTLPDTWTALLLFVHMGAAVFVTATLFGLRRSLPKQEL